MSEAQFPKIFNRRNNMNLGVIGFGFRAYVVIEAMKKVDDNLKIKAVTDIRDLKADLQKYKYSGEEIEEMNFYSDVDDMIQNEKLDGILIGIKCSLHTTMALKERKNLKLH
jgi:predicted dehydrogenase